MIFHIITLHHWHDYAITVPSSDCYFFWSTSYKFPSKVDPIIYTFTRQARQQWCVVSGRSVSLVTHSRQEWRAPHFAAFSRFGVVQERRQTSSLRHVR